MKKLLATLTLPLALALTGCSSEDFGGGSEASRVRDARSALQVLYAHTPGARQLGETATAVLVFPDMTKAGFLLGGQYGTGVLFRGGSPAGFYRSTSASYGLQAGIQKFGYALFFMSPEDVSYLDKSDGWEIGVGPTLTVVDQGVANSISTTTSRKGVYAFFFEQRGLMAGLGIQGTKITKTE